MSITNSEPKLKILSKSLSGIQGLYEITNGGLPTGRPILICGNAGCGKTLLAKDEKVMAISRKSNGEEKLKKS